MANKSKQTTNSSSSSTEYDEKSIQELFAITGKYASSEDFQKLKRLDKDNGELRQDVVNLGIRNEKNLEDFIRLKGEWEVEKEGLVAQLKEKEDERNQELLNRRAVDQMLSAERDTTEKLREQAEEQEAHILRLVKKTKADETELNRLDAISQERNDILDQERRDKAKLQREVNETLKQLETRTNELSDATSSLTICETLAGMFDAALDFFQRKLGHDLDADVLARSNSQTFALNAPPIPLPASNTEDAKRMRVVAGLMVYGKALVNNVFRPTYNTQSHQLDEVLHLTAAQNPSQETFIRAVLLKAAPEKQQQNRESCVELAVQEVLVVVDPWIQNKLEFRSELKHICDRASTAWAQVQLLESRVRPDFHFQHPEEWKALPFPILRSNPTIVSKVGNSKQTPPQKKVQGRQPDLSTASPKLSALNSSDVARVVWPSFLATDPQAFDDETDSTPLELVYYGYVLTQAQIKGAEDETSQASQRVSLRPRKRRDSGVFVSNSTPGGTSSK
ncbi:hypothetical protein VFPPC_12037 [Pochonia chlamydosporia 170]|uniref:MEI5 protein n=1 Tax=Pochonia chlamydosporia 170 TaxID=1380566 RepID=A0A179G449_METCM|nr:hypothetical protein VFPPC_12037 [Pochonia chlamydosporia 170]OAQ71919.1 hypothetical protein VFPPC_12037 [Pochonia chlamydosporia 170]